MRITVFLVICAVGLALILLNFSRIAGQALPTAATLAGKPPVTTPAARPSTPVTAPAARPSAPVASDEGAAQTDDADQGPDWGHRILVSLAITVGGFVVSFTAASAWSVRRRLSNRKTREYARYEIHLSMHDEAKPADLNALLEQMCTIVRAYRGGRFRNGQPFFAFEAFFGPGPDGQMQWTLCLLCEPRHASPLEGALWAAYPDVRLGHTEGTTPVPLVAKKLAVPGAVLRYRKARPFLYAMNSRVDEMASPPLEAIAQAQAQLGVPSAVRIQLMPTMLWMERRARRAFDRKSNELTREAEWGLAEAGQRNIRKDEEMRSAAQRTQDLSMFWFEVQVAADTLENANQLGAALVSDRGANQLHARWMVVREKLYRRRFPTAYPPLLPDPTLRTLVSTVEAAHLVELPTSRLRGVPVRRLTVPRVPAPPEVMPATASADIPLPPAEMPANFDEAA